MSGDVPHATVGLVESRLLELFSVSQTDMPRADRWCMSPKSPGERRDGNRRCCWSLWIGKLNCSGNMGGGPMMRRDTRGPTQKDVLRPQQQHCDHPSHSPMRDTCASRPISVIVQPTFKSNLTHSTTLHLNYPEGEPRGDRGEPPISRAHHILHHHQVNLLSDAHETTHVDQL